MSFLKPHAWSVCMLINARCMMSYCLRDRGYYYHEILTFYRVSLNVPYMVLLYRKCAITVYFRPAQIFFFFFFADNDLFVNATAVLFEHN